MLRILIVNPNTTVSMTTKIADASKGAASPGTLLEAVTSEMGPPSIEGYYDEAFAVPGVVSAILAGERRGAEAAIIACFDDTGLDAARAAARIPVLGICEAALGLMGFLAKRFSIVTTTLASRVPVEELARRYGMADRATVRAADFPVLALEDENSDATIKLKREIERALSEDHAEGIVLGCAGMVDLARALQDEFGVPVIDGVTAAVKQAEALVALGLSTSKTGAYMSPAQKRYSGAMTAFSPHPEA